LTWQACGADHARMSNPGPKLVPAPPPLATASALEIHCGDNLEILARFPAESFDLIYIDPPFNTGHRQRRTQLRTVLDEGGGRIGFRGGRFRTTRIGSKSFDDQFDDYLGFLEPRLVEARRLLKPEGSFFFHIDYREVHYAKVLLDTIFGRASFQNEIIWAYDYGARATKKWSAKHDNILWYAKDPEVYTFRHDDIDRIPYMAPGLVGPEKAARGKTPTDTWWHTIVSPTGKEKTGYPTQKPLGILNRIVQVHSNPGDLLLDFFAGSGTLGEAAVRNGRRAVLVDCNEEAMEVMARRLAFAAPTFHGFSPTS
jgi:site-specific DNA-methyltransferase (adenine-specific)